MDSFEKLYNKSLHFLSFRPRSDKEVRDYLKKNKSDSKTADKIIDKLKDYKFIDDKEFARRWVEQRTKINSKAQRIIRMELRQKGISEEIIEDLEFKEEGDLENASKLAEKRLDRLRNEPPQKQKEKLYRFLSSKGYDYDIIKDVVDKILGK